MNERKYGERDKTQHKTIVPMALSESHDSQYSRQRHALYSCAREIRILGHSTSSIHITATSFTRLGTNQLNKQLVALYSDDFSTKR